MNDLLIGAADKYGWDQIRNWAKSIRKSGFAGRVALILYRFSDPRIQKECDRLNIECYEATHDNLGLDINHDSRSRDTQSHQMRFFHAWQLLQNFPDRLRYVIMTDVRDVVFQSNPSTWLTDATEHESHVSSIGVIAPSEGLIYKDEPWGADNMKRGFGPVVWDQMKDYPIANVGTIAGNASLLADVFLTLYSMGEGRYIPNDQSGFNLLARTLIETRTWWVPMKRGWAAQCGTMLDPTKTPVFKRFWLEAPPVVKDGLVYTSDGTLFTIVHQYDRVPGLLEAVDKRYIA